MRAASPLALVLIAALAAGNGTAAAERDDYPDYRAAQQALERRDCDGARRHLDAFLDKNRQFLEPPYRSFYLAVLRVMGECDGSVVIRGVGEGQGELSPLPEDPPPQP